MAPDDVLPDRLMIRKARMRKRTRLLAAISAPLLAGGMSLVALTGTSAPALAANPVPYPSSLSNHPYATGWSAGALKSDFVDNASNSPGNCTSPDTSEISSTSTYTELATNGNAGDCVYLQSPHTYPTVDGYVYEEEITVSNETQWESFWMYGVNWPTDGEIDALEGGSGTNYLSYHYEGSGGPASYSTCNDTNGCDSSATPIQVGPTGPNITTGTHYIDISYGGHGSGQGEVCVWYDGTEYGCVYGSTVLNGGSGDDPFWIVDDTGSCDSANNGDVCNAQQPPDPGNIKVDYLRIFT